MSTPKPTVDLVHTYLVVKIGNQTITNLTKFKMMSQINNHVWLTFTAAVEDRFRDTYLQIKDVKTKAEVYLKSVTQSTGRFEPKNNQTGDGKLIYMGIITKLKVLAQNNDYIIEVEAASHSYELDIQRQKRSFKDKTRKYSEMVEFFGKENNAKIDYDVAKEWVMDKFFMQYEETDWEFLKRMASRLHTGLVVDPISDVPKLSFGVRTAKPADGTFEYCNFTLRQDSQKYHYEHALNPEIKVEDYICYIIKDSRKQLMIGDAVSLNDRTLYVSEVTLELIGSDLKYHYQLVTQKGLRQSVIYNNRIKGKSITGYVIDVVQDQVKLHLEFDKSHDKDKDCLFPVTTPYAAENHTGWYMMPEIKDQVKLYFPDNFENNAYVITSVRNKELTGVETDAQYLRTMHGQQLMTGSKGLRFTTERSQHGGANQLLRVHAEGGVQIRSDQTINIQAAQDLLIRCKSTATFGAKGELILSSKTKNVIHFKDTIQCDGTILNKQSKSKATAPDIAADLSGIIFSVAATNPEPQAKPKSDSGPKSEEKKSEDEKKEEKGIIPVVLPGVGNTYFERALVPNIQKFVSRCKDELGINIKFSSVYRPKEYQKHLYDIFYYPDHHGGKRSKLNQTQYDKHGFATNVVGNPDRAPHTMGGSFDLANVATYIANGKFEKIKQIAKDCGFKWQGSKDKVHFGNYDYSKYGYKSPQDWVNYNNKRFHKLDKNYSTTCPKCMGKLEIEE